MEVMAIDNNEDRVNEYSMIASHAVVGNTTDEKVLKSLGIRNFDHVIVAIGDNIQASILTTIILKELGVKDFIEKPTNNYNEKGFFKFGADEIEHREGVMGGRIANKIFWNNEWVNLELLN